MKRLKEIFGECSCSNLIKKGKCLIATVNGNSVAIKEKNKTWFSILLKASFYFTINFFIFLILVVDIPNKIPIIAITI